MYAYILSIQKYLLERFSIGQPEPCLEKFEFFLKIPFAFIRKKLLVATSSLIGKSRKSWIFSQKERRSGGMTTKLYTNILLLILSIPLQYRPHPPTPREYTPF